jgi:hypothetical protein
MMNQGFQVTVPTTSNKPVLIKNGVLYGVDSLIAAWVSDRLKAEMPNVPFNAFGIIGSGPNGEPIHPDGLNPDLEKVFLIAGVYWYNHYNGPDQYDITCAVASDTELAGRPDVIRKILEYPFGQLKVPRITGEVVASNERAIRTAEKLGFKIEGMKRKAAKNGEDMVVLGLLPEECPLWRSN